MRRPHCNDKDLGLNPAATRNEKWTLRDPIHGRCPNGLAGAQWKTGDIKADLDL